MFIVRSSSGIWDPSIVWFEPRLPNISGICSLCCEFLRRSRSTAGTATGTCSRLLESTGDCVEESFLVGDVAAPIDDDSSDLAGDSDS